MIDYTSYEWTEAHHQATEEREPMTDKPLSELEQLWIDNLVAETAAPYIRALNREIERLKIWGSDSHVTDLEAKLKDAEGLRQYWADCALKQIQRAEAAEKYTRDLEQIQLGQHDTITRLRAELAEAEKEKHKWHQKYHALMQEGGPNE